MPMAGITYLTSEGSMPMAGITYPTSEGANGGKPIPSADASLFRMYAVLPCR